MVWNFDELTVSCTPPQQSRRCVEEDNLWYAAVLIEDSHCQGNYRQHTLDRKDQTNEEAGFRSGVCIWEQPVPDRVYGEGNRSEGKVVFHDTPGNHEVGACRILHAEVSGEYEVCPLASEDIQQEGSARLHACRSDHMVQEEVRAAHHIHGTQLQAEEEGEEEDIVPCNQLAVGADIVPYNQLELEADIGRAPRLEEAVRVGSRRTRDRE